eukprot:gnl/TRDRNA2_/TRDRNA2_134746_c0_seq1.p1 gnl/TRDRNA2_/TRDRNA2_134746_c0~~gnl/TRDRNA2_/TRDRNA2_134746_c0_seq1.p1  ORF type:complete len:298 (-),score=48.59 gnl/TRDRNA2_/TRDRNA2_134746_c0_seq1:59-952(-)
MAGQESPRAKFALGDLYRDGVYKPLHQELFEKGAAANWSKWLAPSFANVLAAVREGDPCRELREELPGVFSFDLFTEDFCDLLLAEVEHAHETASDQLQRPNGMNRYGLVLNQLGLEPLITALQQEHLLPLQAALYPAEGSAPDDHHCFIVRYKADQDVGLDMHEDDSDVTLNVCIGKEFTGATLSFCGRRSEMVHRSYQGTYHHKKGRAVIHLGRQRHGADNIKTGERVNFILWSISSQYRNSEAYHRQKIRRIASPRPDPICLSYTHDPDYTRFLKRPTAQEALARGVMLDHVSW